MYANDFPFDSVFLRGEGERDMVRLGKVSDWITGGVEDFSAVAESDVAEAERSGLVFGASVVVLVGAHEEVESDPDDIRDALFFGVPVDVVLEDVVEYCDGERLRRRTWRVQIEEEWVNDTNQCAVSEAETELARWVAARHVEY